MLHTCSHYFFLLFLLLACLLICRASVERDDKFEPQGDGFCKRKDDGDVECPSDYRLTRLEAGPGEDGSVQRIKINKDRTLELKTLCHKPMIFEINNFLSSEECDYFIELAKEDGLQYSETKRNQNNEKFTLMDVNQDRQLSVYELKLTIQDSFDIYLGDDEVKSLMKELKLDRNGDWHITPEEMSGSNPKEMADYLRTIVSKRPELQSRHSEQVWLYPDQSTDRVFQDLQHRVSTVTGLPMPLIKRSDFQVVKYGIDGHYNAHYDSSMKTPDEALVCCTREITNHCRICRYMTILFYLNDVESGGGTAFPLANNDTIDAMDLHEKIDLFRNCDSAGLVVQPVRDLREKMDLFRNCDSAGLVVQPVQGKAVVWYNHNINPDTDWMGEMDQFTIHGGCPVIKGEKWIANFWIKTTDDKDYDLKMMSYL